MKIYAVVVLYNGEKWIDRCFGSLRASQSPLTVIAVDNASSDHGLERIRSDYPEVQIIQSAKNLGFGAANNIAMRKAYEEGADFFLLLNQDAWIEPSTVGSLVEVQARDEKYDLLSPMHLTGSGSNLEYGFSRFLKPSSCPNLISDLYFQRTEDRVYPISFAPAAAWLLTRRCVEIVGGFSPTFFHYGEDDNYTQRVHYHGLQMGVYPFAKIFHDTEFRPVQSLNAGKRLAYKKKLLQYSDPNTDKDFRREANKHLRVGLRSALRFSAAGFRAALTEYRHYATIAPTLHQNRERSRRPGLSFL